MIYYVPYSTLIGGSGNDSAMDIVVDPDGMAYITGFASPGYPTRVNAYDRTHNGGYDVFVTKLTSTAKVLGGSTFIGGSENDSGRAIAMNADGEIYITGHTMSSNYPVTDGSYDGDHNGSADVFVTKFDDKGLLFAISLQSP